MRSEPGVIWEHARFLQGHGQETAAVQMLRNVPGPRTQDAGAYNWTPRRQLLNIALKNHGRRRRLLCGGEPRHEVRP